MFVQTFQTGFSKMTDMILTSAVNINIQIGHSHSRNFKSIEVKFENFECRFVLSITLPEQLMEFSFLFCLLKKK